MTNNERLDRIERLAKLFARAGVRERGLRREMDEKINIIIDYQIQNEERFARNEERFARNEERFEKLVESQKNTEKRLNTLIDIVARDRNGRHE